MLRLNKAKIVTLHYNGLAFKRQHLISQSFKFYHALFKAFPICEVAKSNTAGRSGVRFSKVPKLFGHILGDISLFLSSKQRHLEAQNFILQVVILRMAFEKRVPRACCSKVPKLFGRISGDIILFVSSTRRRLEARNFAVIFIFIPFTTYEKTSFTEYAGRSFTTGFSGQKSSRDFRETGPRPELLRAFLVLTSVNYHTNVQVLILLNQWLAQTMRRRATGPRRLKFLVKKF